MLQIFDLAGRRVELVDLSDGLRKKVFYCAV